MGSIYYRVGMGAVVVGNWGRMAEPRSPFEAFWSTVQTVVDTPITWARELVVASEKPEHVWYHRKFRRVPTIDQCYTDDVVCYTEANEQWKRDRCVDNEILNILRQRQEDCIMWNGHDFKTKCADILEDYQQGAENWFAKYGDLGAYGNVTDAFMKQKHRMIWERRHGKIGSGMKADVK